MILSQIQFIVVQMLRFTMKKQKDWQISQTILILLGGNFHASSP